MAHRGDSAHGPENSAAAFELAVQAGADVLETDLWRTTDGHLVCHHDATAERMTGDPRRLDSMTLAEVQSLRLHSRFDADYPHERILTLDELQQLAPSDVVLALELKDPRLADPDAAWELAQLIAERVEGRRVFALSFSLSQLRALKTVAPDVIVGHISMRNPLPTQWTELVGVSWPILAANPLYSRMARWRGRWVAPLDPDLHRRLPRYLRQNVDAVLTNDPAATRTEIERLRST